MKSLTNQYFFPAKPFTTSKYDNLRSLAAEVSPEAKTRLEWIIFYETVGQREATATAKYFGISRKTFHKWFKAFKGSRQKVESLADSSRRPKTLRKWEVTAVQEERIKTLRTKHLKYGKRKLQRIYFEEYQEAISTWKIERVIRAYNLYPNKADHATKLRQQSRRKAQSKALIRDFKPEPTLGFLWHFDTITVWWNSRPWVFFTALEDLTKIGFSHLYQSKASANAADFLNRLRYLTNNQVFNCHQDNGSEFAKRFKEACQALQIPQVFSRPHTPKDNPALERFNRTLQEEWLDQSEVGLGNLTEANQDLTEWLVEYNFKRPHQSLGFDSPIVYAQKHYEVSPMWSASTRC